MTAPKDTLYEQLARLGKALAAPRRVEILDALAQGPRTVERLAAATGLSLANASQHLQVLRRARLVESEKRGLFVTYRLAGDEVGALLVRLREAGEAQLAELRLAREELLSSIGQAERLDRDALIARIGSGEAILIDVRPREEYLAGHLPGALSIPLEELDERLRDLGDDREVVAYCRGPWCLLSADAVRMLSRRGVRASRLEDGVLEWRAAGRRIVTGEEPAAARTRTPRPRRRERRRSK
ncbi:MAG TPA: metalloregulator ArsR/SmtB family transcription factor [Thermoanaerobaculia bacterium]|nr:metalloregulator ArsR/SmtB family transcription factor [Thermoanaerobaculia bacterium]